MKFQLNLTLLGFSVKDSQIGMPSMRCNSRGDLYLLTIRPYHPSSTQFTFSALYNELWHNRLRHQKISILNSFHQNSYIFSNNFQNNFFCKYFQLGKQIKLPFYESLTSNLLVFHYGTIINRRTKIARCNNGFELLIR